MTARQLWKADQINMRRYALEEGRAVGIELGREQGREQGLVKGREEGIAQVARRLLGIVPVSQVAEITGLSLTELKRLGREKSVTKPPARKKAKAAARA